MTSIVGTPPPNPVAGQIPWDVPLNEVLDWLRQNLIAVDATAAATEAAKLPPGGAAGDVLTKVSAADYDDYWAPAGQPSPAVLSYRHVQASPATVWTITHGLNFQPGVLAVDSSRREIWPGEVLYLNDTTIQLTFSAATGGEAYLS